VRLARLAVAASVLALGCGGPGWLARAAWHEVRILWGREPIADLLARPALDPDLRARLALTLRVRDFAAGPLGLAVGDSYTTFAEVAPDARVWVLSAARRDRLEFHTWRYPLVGRLPYRGFFDRGAAEREAGELGARDLDVDVRPAAAFSTLGWFADPLLSTAADAPPAALAETVIHEVFHATLYVPGAAAFNESAATFAGHRGAQAFFCGGPGADPETCAAARRRWAVLRARARVLTRLAARLRRVYAAGLRPSERERQRARLARLAGGILERRGLGARTDLVPPNNARLLGELLYATRLDAFERLAPDDARLGPALRALVERARGAEHDPFAALGTLARGPRGG
jgi:predicted aminopeptidase